MKLRHDFRIWVPFTILACAIVVLFHRLLLTDTLFWGLPSLQFYPWRWFAFEELRNGRIPYWNPYNGGGTPLMANYQSAIFYPPNWLQLVLPGAYAMGFIAMGHVFWAGYGMWKFTGTLELSQLGRGMSMLCFALGSYTIGRFGSFPTAQSVAWIPWLLWATYVVLEKRSYSSVGILALICGLQLLAGHAQSTWYGLIVVGLFALWYELSQLRTVRWLDRLEGLVLAGVGMLLGLALAGWQLYLTGQFLLESQRSGGVDYDTLTNLSYAPARILTFLMPNFYGSPVDGSYLTPGRGVFFEDAAYLGVVPLISATFAVYGWLKWRTFMTHHRVFRSVPLWLFICVAGVFLALGRYGPIYSFLYEHIPTFDSFREPVRWLLWPTLGLSILAGIGVHHWSQSQRALFWTRLGGAAGFGVAAMSAIGILTLDDSAENAETIRVLATGLVAFGCWVVSAAILTLRQPSTGPSRSMAIWQTTVLIVVAADLVWAGAGLNPTVPDDFYNRDFSISGPQGRLYWYEDFEEDVKFEEVFDLSDYRRATNRWTNVRTSLLPNLNMLDRIGVFNNFDPLQPSVHRQYVELIEAAGEDGDALLRGAGISQVVGEVQPVGWNESSDELSAVAPDVVPSFWMVTDALLVEDETAASDAITATAWEPTETVVLIADELPLIASEDMFTTADVRLVQNQATRQRYRIDADGAGYLVIAITHYPGWEARIDGEIVDIYQANLAFMAVAIPEGAAEVTLSYQPQGAEVAVIISLLALFIIVALIALGLIGTT